MRIEIVFVAALAALASAAPQWPYRDAVAPYYYGYPGKTPYMYRAEEDDEMDETTNLGRQDLKVGGADQGSTVTVIEDDEKADGIRVVETGSAKPVAQSGNNLQVQQQQPAPLPAQANQPLVNNAQQQQQPGGQPLTVQQPGANGQQPPAFPPARPQNQQRPRPVDEDEDEDEEDEESEEDDEDAEDDEEGDDDDDDDEDEEDDEDRKRNDVANKHDVSVSVEEEPVPEKQQHEVPVPVVAVDSTSDELVPEVPAPRPKQPPSQSSVLSNKVNKNKQAVAAVVNKKKNGNGGGNKVKPTGAIEALVPGYVTDQGEVLVPVDTVTGSQPITIVPDPFSPPSRIVGGPRPIPQSSIPSTPSRQVPYWYRNGPPQNPLNQEASPLGRQTLYSSVPPPGSIFTFDDDDDDDDDSSPVAGNRLRQEDDDGSDEDEDEDEEDEEKVIPPKPKVPLAAVAATGPSGEDDEAEALNLIRPAKAPRPAKKPAATPAAAASDDDSDEGSEEDDDAEDEEEEEEDDSARRAPAVVGVDSKGRMYVDEDRVSFPPSRSPTILALVQGKFPVYSGQQSSQEYEQQRFSVPAGGNPFQRYVVRVSPARPRPPQGPIYYRPYNTGSSPNKRVTPVASFDISVEDTRPDSDEEGDSIGPGGPGGVPFIYKVQGSGGQPIRIQGGGGRPRPRPSGGPGGSRPQLIYYGAIRQQSYGGGGPRPYPPPYASGYRPSYSGGSGGPPPSFNPYSFLQQAAALSYGGPGPHRRPSTSGGPPVIVRKKPSGPHSRPPKPQSIAVYNPSGQREPVEEEYYTYEVPETDNKFISAGPPGPPNKRPTVHRKPTPVIHTKVMNEEDEPSDEESGPGPMQLIPQGTVRRRGTRQLKNKKNKKSTGKKSKPETAEQDPLGILSKVNKSSSKSKVH